jgi:alpha-tubulin suppressor-like RCC1 family protein
MVSSVKNLKNEIDTRLAGGGLSELRCCQLENASSILDNNVVYSVATINDLPSAETNKGRFVYVESINEYRYSNGEEWADDYDSNPKVELNIFSWGSGTYGRLGDGATTNKCSPVQEISSSTDWCQVSAGKYSSSAVKTSGEIWSWGLNSFFGYGSGQLGDGTTVSKCSPVREISSSTNWCQVDVGNYHTSAVKTSGEIWSWGLGCFGQLGDGATVAKCSPVREISSSTNWCQVSAGGYISSAVKTTGEIWSWGFGSEGRLGNGATTDRCSPVQEISSSTDWCQVSAGFSHSSALKTTGEIWSWGYGGSGRLGNGSFTPYCSPVREISSSNNWCQVSTGYFHSSAIKTTGEIWSWGSGFSGILGNGATTYRSSPVREISSSTNWCQVSAGNSGNGHSSAIKTTGEIWSWGSGIAGVLGNGAATSRCSPVREISSSTNWCQVSAGSINSSAIKLIYIGGFNE